MIPTGEMNVLHTDAAAAVNLALAGEVADGAAVLMAGLDRAETLREQWADELAGCYRKALDAYCRRYRSDAELRLPPLVNNGPSPQASL